MVTGKEIEQTPLFEGEYVNKTSGYQFPGVVVAVFQTSAGKTRYVVENMMFPGMLHIFSGEQLCVMAVDDANRFRGI